MLRKEGKKGWGLEEIKLLRAVSKDVDHGASVPQDIRGKSVSGKMYI